ncbi:hypothetical protein JCM6882_009003 [Rhodosporidiobolus microsporus]
MARPSSPLAAAAAAAVAPHHPAASRSLAVSASDRLERNRRKLDAVSRDFRTDTLTLPTDEMVEAMRYASRGDDVYGEDEDTLELQERVAKMAGKEAALFCASGTMTNQLAVRAHLTAPPHSIVLDSRAHIHRSEAGGVAFHSAATTYPVAAANGHHVAAEEVLGELVAGDDVHGAPTRLVCVENTLSGMIFPQEELLSLRRALDSLPSGPIPLHCDGARLWEVMAKTGMSLEEACRPFETASLCLSKGLGAPVGSILVGPKDFIKKVTHLRKLFGGGMRQTGSLALAASHCLTSVLPQLPRTHALAARLASALVAPDIGSALELPVETNMVWVDSRPAGFSLEEWGKRAWEEAGVRLYEGWGRVVVHYQVSEEAVDALVEVTRRLAEEKRRERDEWEKEVGAEEVEEVRRRSEKFARGEWEGERMGKSTKGAYGKGKAKKEA